MEHPQKMRALVVDGIPITRFAVGSLIDLHPLVGSFEEARDVPEARQRCAEFKPDLVILDLNLPRGDGLELIRDVQGLRPTAFCLIMSEEEDIGLVHRAFRAGARAYVSKRDEPAELLAAIEAASSGRYYASRSVSQGLLRAIADGPFVDGKNDVETLSNRELHIFRLIGRSLGATAIARELGVSVKTIETHQCRIKEKLGLRSCEELRQRAVAWVTANSARLADGKRPSSKEIAFPLSETPLADVRD